MGKQYHLIMLSVGFDARENWICVMTAIYYMYETSGKILHLETSISRDIYVGSNHIHPTESLRDVH